MIYNRILTVSCVAYPNFNQLLYDSWLNWTPTWAPTSYYTYLNPTSNQLEAKNPDQRKLRSDMFFIFGVVPNIPV